jgi:uncharacterized Zn-finger protein
MREAVCPKCGSKFDTIAQRTYRGIGHDIKKQVQTVHKAPEAWIDESAEVKCPGCNHVFTSEAVRFFGILSPKVMKILIGLFVFVFLVFAMFALFKSF